MNFDVVTLFPGLFAGGLQESIQGRARRAGRVSVRLHDLRRWGVGRHNQVDDNPYGGGGGMILRPEPFYEAVDWVRERHPAQHERVVLLSPQGQRLTHDRAKHLASYERVILLCGRYEGVDERVREGLADEELSIGDMVLTGGELPAMVVIDAVSRFIPGVLGRKEAADEDSFAQGQLDSPYYTRPPVHRGRAVPEVLLSGDHRAISQWREEQAREATRIKRPDLLTGEGRHGGARAR
jgi:tRNA (guanine37-N1)-methyltransferase